MGKQIYKITLFNLVIVLAGMVCRYLLEYGEVSNTYNFTIPNILFHIVAALGISIISYIVSKSSVITK